jgi:signal peptidase I
VSRLSSLGEGNEVLEQESVPMWVDLARSLFPVFLIVLLLRSFLAEPFRIPSASMMPTLLIGDFILVNKYTYGLRLPVLNTKIVEINQPERGDVVVFRYPEDPSIPFIKRIVGLPGDRIAYDNLNKVLYVNEQPMTQDMLGVFNGVGSGSNMTGAEERLEHMNDGKHTILVMPDRLSQAPYLHMVIPEGHYFVLGDNRDNSRDSRYWGTVPEENLIGKAFLIWMNFDWANGGIDWRRLGSRIL